MAPIPLSVTPELSQGRPANGGRDNIPECYRDIENWPGFDASVLKGKDLRRYERLRDATVLYLHGRPMREVVACAEIGERRFLRVFARCLTHDTDGRIFGCRAFVNRARLKPFVRKADFAGASADGKGGYCGMFGQLMERKKEVASRLTDYLNAYGLAGLRPNKVMFRTIHRQFLTICREEGVGERAYPFNTRERGRKALRQWIDTDYLPRYAQRFTRQEHGEDAAGLLAYGAGTGDADRNYHGYGAWIIDAVTIDVHARYELPNDSGDWESLTLRRFQQLRCIHKGSSCNLACRQVYAPQVSAEDVSILLWDSLNGPPSVPTTIAGLVAETGAGYPALMIPQLRFAIPSVIYLDNALAHLADHIQHIATVLFGCRVILGRPKTPRERAQIESKFALQARRVVHQLPATTGNGPQDPARKTHAVAVQERARADDLEQVLDIYARNENILPAAGAHNVQPLERLRRQIAAGVLNPQYLPVDKRKAYYFSMPQRVVVRMNAEGGRRPYINFLYQRYSSADLGKRFALKNRPMYVRPDHRNLRTVMLFYEDGTEFGPVQALGHWGTFPHDVRIRKLFARLKRDAEFDTRADDRPLEALFGHLRAKAPRSTTAALWLTYLIEYLKRQGFVPSPVVAEHVTQWTAITAQAAAIEVLPVGATPLPLPASVPLVLPGPSQGQVADSPLDSQAGAIGEPGAPGPTDSGASANTERYALRRRSFGA